LEEDTAKLSEWVGNTASRPEIDKPCSQPYFDIELNKPIWWDGTQWIDATGTAV
jgi:hypothetical protein